MTACLAGVEWEQTTQEIVPKLQDLRVVAHYRFKITGDQPVTFASLSCSCSCLTATLAKKTYPPEESGEVVVTLPFGERQGAQQKLVAVQISGQAQPVLLTLKAIIPSLLAVETASLAWDVPEQEHRARRVRVHVADPKLGSPLKAESSHPDVEVRLEPVEGSPDFWLVVAPKPGASSLSAVIRLTKGWPEAQPQVVTLAVRVN